MTKRVIIFGTAAFAEVVHSYLTYDSDYEVVAFSGHRKYIEKSSLLGLPVVAFEDLETQYPPSSYAMFVAVGYLGLNQIRADICQEVRQKGYELVSYIYSGVIIPEDSKIGDNTFIFEDNTLQPGVQIGQNVVLWSGNHLGICATVMDHCFITSHCVLGGNIKVGPYSFIGVNSTLNGNISIGARCLIGAGSLIKNSLPDKTLVVPKRTYANLNISKEQLSHVLF